MFYYILNINTEIEEYIDVKYKSKIDFREDAFKTIGITNIKGVGGADGGNNTKKSNSTRNINNIAAFTINIENII